MIDSLSSWFSAGLWDAVLLGRAVLCTLLALAAVKLLLEGAKLALAWCRGVWRES